MKPIAAHCSPLLAAGAMVLAGLSAGGCQTAHVAHPLTAQLSGNAPETQLEFWHTLAEQHVTSNDEAFHGLLLYLGSKDDTKDYPARVAALSTRNLLPTDFRGKADDAVDRGTMAFAMVRILNIRGGWVMHVFGPTPRYAIKELVSMDLLPPSSQNQTFSGSEFLGIIGKLDDAQAAVASK